MAPKNPDPLDPDRIDISLDLVGGESLAHVQALTDQLGTLTTYLANIQTGTPTGDLSGMQNIAGRLQGGIQHGSHPYQSRPDGRSAADGAGLGASNAQDVDRAILERESGRGTFKRLVANIRSPLGVGGAIDEEMKVYGATERQQARRRTPAQRRNRYADLYGGSMGGVDTQMEGSPSAGASTPELVDSGGPLWRQAALSNRETWESSQEGIRLPPGGLSLSTQDKVRLAADLFTRRAERQYQTAMQEAASLGFTQEEFDQHISGDVGRRSGRIAMGLRLAEEQGMAPLAVAQDAYGRIRGRMQQAYNFGGGLQQAGVQAGYSRAGQINIPGTNIGITNPLDYFKSNSAAAEGLNQRINTMRLRLMGGIDGTQAKQIVGGLAGSGWTGEQGQNIAFDAIAPLVQQGMNPELAVASYDQIMRQGNASIGDFLKTMDKLGESARTANMSLDEYQQGLMQFSETAQSLGATGVQGARLGRQLTDTLGIAPQVAGELMQSPLVQGVSLRQGFLPNEIGLMTGNQTVGATYQALDLAMSATAGFRSHPIRDPATGRVTATGADQQIAQVATLMGVSTDLVKRLQRQRNFATAAGQATSQLSVFEADVQGANKARGAEKSLGHLSSGQVEVVKKILPDAYRKEDGTWAIAGDPSPAQQRSLDSHLNREFYTTKHTLAGGAPDIRDHPHMHADYMHELSQIGKGQDGKERASSLHSFIRKWGAVGQQPEDGGPTVYVKFKGAAAKWFEQDNTDAARSRRASNAGGQTQAEIAAGLPTSREAAAQQRNFWLNNNIASGR